MNQNPRGQKRASGDAHHQVRGASKATNTIAPKYNELSPVKSPSPPPSKMAGSERYEAKSITQSYDRREGP